MTAQEVVSAVLALLGDKQYPALRALASPAYVRELVPVVEGGLLRLKLEKRGWRSYKRRCPRPQGDPPPADLEGILRALRSAGLPAVKATDQGTFIFAYFVIKENDS